MLFSTRCSGSKVSVATDFTFSSKFCFIELLFLWRYSFDLICQFRNSTPRRGEEFILEVHDFVLWVWILRVRRFHKMLSWWFLLKLKLKIFCSYWIHFFPQNVNLNLELVNTCKVISFENPKFHVLCQYLDCSINWTFEKKCFKMEPCRVSNGVSAELQVYFIPSSFQLEASGLNNWNGQFLKLLVASNFVHYQKQKSADKIELSHFSNTILIVFTSKKKLGRDFVSGVFWEAETSKKSNSFVSSRITSSISSVTTCLHSLFDVSMHRFLVLDDFFSNISFSFSLTMRFVRFEIVI